MLISIVCNLDSRPGVSGDVSEFTAHNQGTRNWDFFTAGLLNKLAFFKGFQTELIVFIDEHEAIPEHILNQVRLMADTVVLRSHNRSYRGADHVGYFNDLNYLRALFMARGEIIAHFDADTAAFTRDKAYVDGLIALLDQYKFISYPSRWSPNAVDDPSFEGRTWASTRFFLCRRESLQFDVLERALREPEWAYETFGRPARQLPWLEHFLSLVNGESVLYPPRDDANTLIFCWSRYLTGILPALYKKSFDEVADYVLNRCGGVQYPCDVRAGSI